MTSALALLIAFGAGAASADAALKSPKKVEKSLATFNRVVDHTARLITAKNYTHLLHENDELKEGAEALEKNIAKEPDDFQAKVKPLLEKAEADSQALADAAKAKDDDRLSSAHAALVASVSALIGAFPAAVQPPPGKAKEPKETGPQK
jgi:hypothetical protein